MGKKKCIWIICQYAVPVKYGFGTRHFYIAKEFVSKGYEVYIISCAQSFLISKGTPPDQKKYNFETIDGINVIWIKGIKYKNSSGILRVFSWFLFSWRLLFLPIRKLQRPDYIIVSSLSLIPIINGYLFKKKFKSKLFFEIRDIWPQTIIELGNYSKYNPLVLLLGAIEKFGYRKADWITATMPKADLHIAKRIKTKFQFKCIPQGFDKEFFNNPKELDSTFIQKYVPQNKFIIGYAGALGVSNALEILINVSLDLCKTYEDVYIVFLGDGPQKDDLQKLAQNSDNIIFAPKQNKEFVLSFLHKCDILYDGVQSVQIYQYGLSRNKWMDYMYSGKPIIASYSGYPSLINEADCGDIVPAEDIVALKNSILKYYKMDKKDREYIGNRGKDFLIKYRTYESIANMYIELFN